MTYTLHLGDCLEFMRTLPDKSVDAVITDPPYDGLKGGLSFMGGGVAPALQPSVTVGNELGDGISALRELERVCKMGAVVFCSWQSVGKVRDACGGEAVGLVTWYKRNTQPSFRNRPHYQCEYAWLIEYGNGMNWKPLKTFYDIAGLPAGCFANERILDGTGKAAHPTQKPLSLTSLMLQSVPDGATVLDPFMGSGTTGVACMQLGRNFIGCEIEPKYYAIAERRIKEAAAQMVMPLAMEARA